MGLIYFLFIINKIILDIYKYYLFKYYKNCYVFSLINKKEVIGLYHTFFRYLKKTFHFKSVDRCK